MIAVFARPNHPHYKQANGADSGEWYYHGYVLAFVRYRSGKQLREIIHKLAADGLPEPFGHDYEQGWYGGRMDLIAIFPGTDLARTPGTFPPLRPGNEKQSIGDNRYAGFYDVSELLGTP